MRYIILFAILVNSTFAFSQRKEKLEQEILVDNILLAVEINQFSSNIEKIKRLKTIEKLDEIEYELKNFQEHLRLWSFFDEEKYLTEFRYTIKKGFNIEELKEIQKFMDDPFFVKILKKLTISRDLFNFFHNFKESDVKILNVKSSRLKALDAMYELLGLNIQFNYMQNKLKDYAESGNQSIREFSIVTQKRLLISPLLMKRRLNRAKQFFLEYLAYDLAGIADFEINEFNRKLRKNKMKARFANFFVNYHFTYMKLYFEKLSRNSNRNIKVVE